MLSNEHLIYERTAVTFALCVMYKGMGSKLSKTIPNEIVQHIFYYHGRCDCMICLNLRAMRENQCLYDFPREKYEILAEKDYSHIINKYFNDDFIVRKYYCFTRKVCRDFCLVEPEVYYRCMRRKKNIFYPLQIINLFRSSYGTFMEFLDVSVLISKRSSVIDWPSYMSNQMKSTNRLDNLILCFGPTDERRSVETMKIIRAFYHQMNFDSLKIRYEYFIPYELPYSSHENHESLKNNVIYNAKDVIELLLTAETMACSSPYVFDRRFPYWKSVNDLVPKLSYLCQHLESTTDKQLVSLYMRFNPHMMSVMSMMYDGLAPLRKSTKFNPQTLWDVDHLAKNLTAMVIKKIDCPKWMYRNCDDIVVTQRYFETYDCVKPLKITRYTFDMKNLHDVLVNIIECFDEDLVKRIIQRAARKNRSHSWYYGIYEVSEVEPRVRPLLDMIRLKKLCRSSHAWKRILKKFPSDIIRDMKQNPTFVLTEPARK
jgi:hypothetical protein